MTISLFLLGLFIIYGIARYNESNKLFWTLLVPLLLGFAVTKMIVKDHSSKGEETVLIQNNPIQGLAVTNSDTACALADTLLTTKKETSDSVGKDSVLTFIETSLSSSKVSTKVRDQPVHMFPNPPTSVFFYNTS